MDPFVFASLAHVRILLLPVGDIRSSTFDKWATEIKTFDTIALSDITTDAKDERSRFMPNHQLATGHLHLSYPSHPPPDAHAPLSLFRTSDFPLGVVGVASCSQNSSLSDILSSFQSTVGEVFDQHDMFPLARSCFVFEEHDSSTNINLGDNLPGLRIIPSVLGHKKAYIGTLLADLCSHILGDLATVISTLESPLGNEYLNATMFPHLPPTSEMPRSLDQEPRRDSLPPLPSQHSQPDLSTTSGQLRSKTPVGVKRNSSMGPGLLPSRHASLPPTPATTVATNLKKRPMTIGAVSSHGRLFKVLADYFLLAGRLEEAAIWYNEAIILCKSPNDSVWLASAYEGLATIPVVEAWSSTHGINGSANEKEPWADALDKLSQAIAIYHKAIPTSEPERTLSILAYLYCSSVLRHSTLLFSIWSSKGWGPLAFTTMLQPGPFPYLPPALEKKPDRESGLRPRNTYAELERLSVITGITRSQISASLTQAHGPWLLHLEAGERVRILQAIAAIFGALGHLRKEAYILREVLGCIMDLVVCGREETGTGSARVSAGLGRTSTMNQGTVGIRENESSDGNASVVLIVKHICRVHGIDLDAVKLVQADAAPNRDSLASQASVDDNDEDELLAAVHEPFGWPELQIGLIREAVAVAEALPDYPAVAQFSLASLKLLHPVMSPGDQHHLYSTASRALLTAGRRGDRRMVEYWSGKPVTSIAVLPLPLVRVPMEKPISALSITSSGINPILSGVRDPFLYNPRRLLAAQDKVVLVQNESFELVVTLQNPYVFDLELQSVQLSTSGVPFVSKPSPVVIPANSFHPLTIAGKATEAGTLVVRGCIVQAPGSVPREFVLPLATDEEEERRDRRHSAIVCDSGRSKYAGLDSRPWEKQIRNKRASTQPPAAADAAPAPAPAKRVVRYLECTVVPEQPLLRIRRTSLTHGAVMLYNGEMSTIRITFENVSALPINLVRLTFDDSTIAPAQLALAEGELSVFDTYEMEYDLIRRPVFTWDGTREPQDVGPGQKRVVTVSCFGKVGCTSGAINVSYAYVRKTDDKLQAKPAEVFYTRQLSYPVLVTVYHMLECHAMDILSYWSATAVSTGADDGLAEARARKALLNVGDVADWCLFSIEVRNTYGLPFEVTFERNQENAEPASTTSLVAPGSTCRIVLPIKKILLSEEHISRPIPTLSDRQFVVTKSNLSAAEERAQRELFWYREELFKVVRGRWRENGGTRAGDLSLRQQRMTQPMLEALRVEPARVRMTLVRYDDDGEAHPVAQDAVGAKYVAPPNDFVYLRTTLTNLSPTDLVVTLSLTLDPPEHVIHQGAIGDMPIGRLAPGASHEVETPVAFMSCGRFQFLAQAYGLPRSAGPVGQAAMRISVEGSTLS